MKYYEIIGGKPLTGKLAIHGAKNSVLPILAAALLAHGESVIHNCPDLSDVSVTLDILRTLGCRVRQEGSTVTIDATVVTRKDIPDRMMREMRSSVIFLGALLAREGGACLCCPGGCQLGSRPIDLHLSALRQLGAEIEEDAGGLRCRAVHMTGQEIFLPLPSVGATENIMLAACGCEGITTIVGAAQEPEIVDLQQFLTAMGASISGAGSSVIKIEGGKPLHGTEYTVIGDRIVAATYLAAVAATTGEAMFTGADSRHLTPVLSVLKEAGCHIQESGKQIAITAKRRLRAVRPIRTAPYPGFPTDAQALLMAAFTTAEDSTMFIENIFESRYRHVDELRRMGAEIQVSNRVALVNGVKSLHSATVRGDDLRGGAALVVAALSAQGVSRVYGLQHVQRGYQSLHGDLETLGAEIILQSENEHK